MKLRPLIGNHLTGRCKCGCEIVRTIRKRDVQETPTLDAMAAAVTCEGCLKTGMLTKYDVQLTLTLGVVEEAKKAPSAVSDEVYDAVDGFLSVFDLEPEKTVVSEFRRRKG